MPQRPLAVRNVSPEELDELYRRTRMSRLCTRKRRKEIAELLEALLDEHSRETVYVAWDNAITHQNDEIEAIVRDAGTDAFHHWSQTPSWHVILFTLSNIKHRVTHVPPNVSNKTHNHVIASGATQSHAVKPDGIAQINGMRSPPRSIRSLCSQRRVGRTLPPRDDNFERYHSGVTE